jgi:hypothetical protein
MLISYKHNTLLGLFTNPELRLYNLSGTISPFFKVDKTHYLLLRVVLFIFY